MSKVIRVYIQNMLNFKFFMFMVVEGFFNSHYRGVDFVTQN